MARKDGRGCPGRVSGSEASQGSRGRQRGGGLCGDQAAGRGARRGHPPLDVAAEAVELPVEAHEAVAEDVEAPARGRRLPRPGHHELVAAQLEGAGLQAQQLRQRQQGQLAVARPQAAQLPRRDGGQARPGRRRARGRLHAPTLGAFASVRPAPPRCARPVRPRCGGPRCAPPAGKERRRPRAQKTAPAPRGPFIRPERGRRAPPGPRARPQTLGPSYRRLRIWHALAWPRLPAAKGYSSPSGPLLHTRGWARPGLARTAGGGVGRGRPGVPSLARGGRGGRIAPTHERDTTPITRVLIGGTQTSVAPLSPLGARGRRSRAQMPTPMPRPKLEPVANPCLPACFLLFSPPPDHTLHFLSSQSFPA